MSTFFFYATLGLILVTGQFAIIKGEMNGALLTFFLLHLNFFWLLSSINDRLVVIANNMTKS